MLLHLGVFVGCAICGQGPLLLLRYNDKSALKHKQVVLSMDKDDYCELMCQLCFRCNLDLLTFWLAGLDPLD